MQHTFTNNENRIQILRSKCHASRHGRRYHKTKHDEYYSIDERSLDKYNFIRRSTAMQIKERTERPEGTALLFWGSREHGARFSSSQARRLTAMPLMAHPRPTRAGQSGRRKKQAGSYAAGCLFAFAWLHGTQRYVTPRDTVCFSC